MRKNKIIVLLAILLLSVAATAQEKLISLNYKNADIRTVLKAFSQKTGFSVVPDAGVSGRVTAQINKMKPMEALEALLDAYSLTYAKKGGIILVSSDKTAAGLSLRSFNLKYVKAGDIKDILNNVLDKGRGEGISISSRLNAVSLQATPKKMRILSKMISNLDQPPIQVQVEAQIIELKAGSGDTTNPSALGASWQVSNSQDANDYAQLLTGDSLTSGASSPGMYAQLLSGNVSAYLSALEKTIGYDLVASPWITALNHEEAEILIGAKYGYRTSIITDTSTVQEVKFLEVGTKLKFTPHINEDGYIRMTIYPSVSEGTVVDELPQENTTETKNEVLVKNGQTIVIGGLTKNYNNQVEVGVPLLSHIPLLGMLFRRTELRSEKREIVVLITPHIVTPAFLEEMLRKANALSEARDKKANEARLIK